MSERPDARYLAFDVSADAIALARENAAACGVAEKVIFAQVELADAMEPETADAVICNLPYIPTSDCETLPPHIRDHEPRIALDGGETGLEVIEAAVYDASLTLKPGGWLFLEIGSDQGEAVSRILRDAGFDSIAVKPDLAGLDRVVTGMLPPR